MGSSSGDSFLWTDASNSNNMSINSDTSDFEHYPQSATNYIKSVQDSNLNYLKDFELDIHSKKAKKRKKNESNSSLQTEKQIKLEPESDKEARRKNNEKGDTIINKDDVSAESLGHVNCLNVKVKQEQASLPMVGKPKKLKKHKSSILKDDTEDHMENDNGFQDYLERRVKEEQVSLIVSDIVKAKKKKKHRKTSGNIDDLNDSLSVRELDKSNLESYINFRVKEEQESTIEFQESNYRKKKNRKNSSIDSDTENSSNFKSSAQLNTDLENTSLHSNEKGNMDYGIIEEKFHAEETIIQKPKKRKHKKDKNVSLIYNTNYEEKDSSIDTSLQPNDFTCNNIASSTAININTMDTLENNQNYKADAIQLRNNELQRKTRISDMIRFEDDDSLTHPEVNLSKSSKIKVFLKVNPHLQFSAKTQSNVTISEDDELWIIRCPREMNYQKLKNTTLSVESKCKIKIDGQSYDGILNENINRLTLMAYTLGQPSVTNWPIKGFVNYRKKIPKSYIPDNINLINNQTNFIPLPETKCRHPLFGANYKKAIKIPAVVKERLIDAAQSKHPQTLCETSIKKHKKSKRNSCKDTGTDNDSNKRYEPVKKNRKRKGSQDHNASPKKKRHKKYDPDSAEVWESEKAIEEKLFNY